MKNSLLLITLLFSFNAFGAKSKYSDTGLEGWGKSKVFLNLSALTLINAFQKQAVRNKIELRLRQADIPLVNRANEDIATDLQFALMVHITPVIVNSNIAGYSVSIKPERRVVYSDNIGITYWSFAAFGNYSGVSSDKLIPFIDSLMDKFLLDYLKANPKKE